MDVINDLVVLQQGNEVLIMLRLHLIYIESLPDFAVVNISYDIVQVDMSDINLIVIVNKDPMDMLNMGKVIQNFVDISMVEGVIDDFEGKDEKSKQVSVEKIKVLEI